MQPYQGEGSDTVKTEEHTEHKQIVQWRNDAWPILRMRCCAVAIVVFMDMVTFIVVFMVGFFVVTNMATIATTCLICDVPALMLNNTSLGRLTAATQIRERRILC